MDFQKYWDRQIKRLEKKLSPTEMNQMFDECEKAFKAGKESNYCKVCGYSRGSCICDDYFD